MLNSGSLYSFEVDPGSVRKILRTEINAELKLGPVLIYNFTGFGDAGSAGALAVSHLLDSLDSELILKFNVDELLDYRARRPSIVFQNSQYTDLNWPSLNLYLMRDAFNQPFLLLAGPEPDYAWQAFTNALIELVDIYEIETAIGLHSIGVAVPHTRPSAVTAHGSRRDLVSDYEVHFEGRFQLPASVAAALEFELGSHGKDAIGFGVHVPHYVAGSEYPRAASTLLEIVGKETGLVLPTGDLAQAAEQTHQLIEEQMAKNEEIRHAVRFLEKQYDANLGNKIKSSSLNFVSDLPSGDVLGDQLERFLASEESRKNKNHWINGTEVRQEAEHTPEPEEDQ